MNENNKLPAERSVFRSLRGRFSFDLLFQTFTVTGNANSAPGSRD